MASLHASVGGQQPLSFLLCFLSAAWFCRGLPVPKTASMLPYEQTFICHPSSKSPCLFPASARICCHLTRQQANALPTMAPPFGPSLSPAPEPRAGAGAQSISSSPFSQHWSSATSVGSSEGFCKHPICFLLLHPFMQALHYSC